MTYDFVNQADRNEFSKRMAKAYDSDGWLFLHQMDGGHVWQMKILGCKSDGCIYLERKLEHNPDIKFVTAYRIKCGSKTIQSKGIASGATPEPGYWTTKRKISSLSPGEVNAYKKLC